MNPVDQWRAIGYEAFRCNEAKKFDIALIIHAKDM